MSKHSMRRGGLGQAQVALERRDGARDAVHVLLLLGELPLAEEEVRVGLNHRHEVHLLAALRDLDLDAAALALAQERLDRAGVRDVGREVDLVGEELGAGVVGLEERLGEVRVLDRLDVADGLVLAADDLALADLEQDADGDVRLAVHGEGEEVAVGLRVRDHLLLLLVDVEGAGAVAELGGLLELLLGGEAHHLGRGGRRRGRPSCR